MGLIDKWLVDDKIKQERLDICNNCPNLVKATGQCKICFCFVKLKTSLKTEECPDKKWIKINVSD
jgi:hypothetical protein